MNNPEMQAQGQPSEAAPAFKRNPRASVEQMRSREQAALGLIDTFGEVDVYLVAKDLNLSVPQALTVVFNLVKKGKIERIGTKSRRVVFAKTTAPTPIAKPTPISAVKLPLHLGQELEVTEIRWTGSGIQAQVKTKEDTETYVLALVS